MLINDYLSSNIIICICLFRFDPFKRARTEIQKYFRSFLVQMKNSNFASEIYWPLLVSNAVDGSPGWAKIQSNACSKLFSVILRALMAFSRVNDISINILMLSSSGATSEFLGWVSWSFCGVIRVIYWRVLSSGWLQLYLGPKVQRGL